MKKTVKKIIDVMMILILPILAAEIPLGQESHEWLGIGMFGLFIMHHVLNYKWFQGMVKGEYSLVRAFVTGLNLLLLVDFIALAYSSLMISGFVFRWWSLPGSRHMARTLHLSAAEWSLILMPLHTGVHSGLHGAARSGGNGKANGTDSFDAAGVKEILRWFGRGILSAAAVFGVYAFMDLKMFDYLFLQTNFMAFNESGSLAMYFAEVICMMMLFGMIGHWTTSLLKKIKVREKGKKAAKFAAFLIPVVICLTVIIALHSDTFNGGNRKGNGVGRQGMWGDTEQQPEKRHKDHIEVK